MKLAQTLLNLAFYIAPRKARVWLEDMRYEASFIENPLPWSLSALGLALRWRLAHILSTPSQMAVASVAMAAVAAIMILPNMLNPNTVPASVTALPAPATTETYIDPSVSRYAEAQSVPAENAEADAGFSEPLPPTLPTPAPATTEAAVPETAVPEAIISEPVPPTLPSPEALNATHGLEAEATDVMSETMEMSQGAGAQTSAESLPEDEISTETSLSDTVPQEMSETSLNPEASPENSDADIEALIEAALEQKTSVLELASTSVKLSVTKEVRLEIYQGTSARDELLFSGTSSAATLNYDLPIYVKASDGSAIELTWGEDSSMTLDDGEIEKVIQTTP